MTTDPLRQLVEQIRALPRYTEYHVKRRPSTTEYLDADSVDELLEAILARSAPASEDEKR